MSSKPGEGLSRTWRALQARLNTVRRSVGKVALGVFLDSEREPPMRRDHYREREREEVNQCHP